MSLKDSDFITIQEFYESKDGTRIPVSFFFISLSHRLLEISSSSRRLESTNSPPLLLRPPGHHHPS